MGHESSGRYVPPGFADTTDADGNIVENVFRAQILNINNIDNAANNNYTVERKVLRERLMECFNGCGEVPWQTTHLRYTC